MVLIKCIIMDNCRLCNDKPGHHEISRDKLLVKEIFECLKIKVDDQSMKLLPKHICDDCNITIRSFIQYKKDIRKVDKSLREFLRNKPVETKNLISKNGDSLDEYKAENLCKKSVRKCTPIIKTPIKAELEICEAVVKEEIPEVICTISKEESDNNQELNSDKKSKFVCTWKGCQKVLNSTYTLKVHELKHEGKYAFLCMTCGKGFTTKNSLICHEKIHLDVKGYTCKLCNIGFSVRSNLRAHELKYHEGVRFHCSQCTKQFASKCSLQRHESIHSGVKEFQCESCPSAFYTNKELVKHQRYHQGLKLYKCDQCYKRFFERHHLVIHLRSHTGERPYVCKVPNCGKSFTESQKLKRHNKAKHGQT